MLDRIRIVLVNTSHPGNIGAVARAMKNMCMSQLVLIQPQDFPSEEALRRSSGADDLLGAARVVDSLDEALDGCVWVVGASARMRNLPWPVAAPREVAGLVSEKAEQGDVAILFGREHSGLTNEELQRCNFHVHIPSNPEYSSLNIAMAVQVICYELYLQSLLENEESDTNIGTLSGPMQSQWDEPPATATDVEGLIQHLEEALIDIRFHDPERPRQLMPRLRRLFQRANLDKMEVNILRGMLKSVQKVAGTWNAEEQNSPRR
ncbi:tRNA (cytosine(32)/uridine(32)-2'-O)-methyltransferase TrmJ [Hahella sp. CCB-MM4]|uniref:RNA methyltransferase n=1 Tax=Hahella sp. (strain CCB-MM4) TaxID=1926491 RepID=UPI000B9BC6FC|nr:RNA methyltransferase [Hahella sp. CCB-MM4]OZG73845.1 tRNA (cytosine(32)/uridine(32)-2'-O)-methyltransferase TrmJ [Hahella sp. CCB-MM4]